MTPLIEVRDLKVAFRTGKTDLHPAVRGVSFDIPANATVALVGESGSGKSVSAMSIVRLLPENAVIGADSRILYQGADLLQRAARAACATCAARTSRWCSRSP